MRTMRVNLRRLSRRVLPVAMLSRAACSSGGDDGSSAYQPVATTTGAQLVADGECSAAREVAAALSSIDTSDPAGLAALPDSVRSLHDVVPEELTAGVNLLGDAIGTFVGVLQRFDFDVAKVEADAAAKAELDALDTPEVRTAVADLQAWLDDSCA